MRTIGNLTAVAALSLCGLIVVACQKSDPDPNTAAQQQGAYQQQGPQSGYPQAGQPQANGAYPTGTATAAPYPTGGAPQAYPTGAPTGAPTAAPTGGGQMATPNQLALACQNDQACGLAHCNVPAGKCAFPCQNSAVDCIQGASCNTMSGLCLPGGS